MREPTSWSEEHAKLRIRDLMLEFAEDNGLSEEDVCALTMLASMDQLSRNLGEMKVLEAIVSCISHQVGVLQKLGVDIGDGVSIPLDESIVGEDEPLTVRDILPLENDYTHDPTFDVDRFGPQYP